MKKGAIDQIKDEANVADANDKNPPTETEIKLP